MTLISALPRLSDPLQRAVLAQLGGAPETVTPLRQGGNSRVFRVAGQGRAVLWKVYPGDRRGRAEQEYAALDFLTRHGIEAIPRPLALDGQSGQALHEWIEAEPAGATQAADVEALADFFLYLQTLRNAAGAEDLVPASAACFSAEDALIQAEQRLSALHTGAGGEELEDFLGHDLKPALRRVRAMIIAELADPQALLAPSLRVLSPSDFGIHNMLRRADGRRVFVDFEYFGWDDPVKAVSDMLLHPGSALTDDQAARLADRLIPVLSAQDALFAVRYRVMQPLFALIWCLIMLNCYLPDRRAAFDAAALRGQLEKSRALFKKAVEA